MIASKKNDSALEVAFEEETRQRLIKDTRTAVFASFFMYPVFVPLDYLFYPKLAGIFLLLRVAVVLLGAVVLSLLKTTFAKDHPRPLAIFEYLNGALAIVLMVHLADGYLSPYYAGINLVFICMLFIVPMNVKETGLVAGIVYAAYIIPILIKGGIVDIRSLAGNNFFMVSTMLLAVLSSYLATQMRRKEFTSRYELGHALEELRELDVLKSQFFASISHEIRTPLTSVLAPTESLRRGEVEPLQTGQKSLVDQVHRNSLRLLDLINQMLDFAKFDAGKMKLRLKRVNMSALARNNVTLFKDVCFRKGVSLEHQISPDIPIVYLDKEKVERIISNLVRNAIKFTDRGRITVALSMEEIDGKQWIILKVSDTGIGISFEDREKVFEHFHQVDGSTTRQYEGTGLGLSIVQESVGLQHGFVEVDSEVGTGSTFTVGLPTDLDLREPEAEIDRREVDRRQEAKDFGGIDRRTSDRRRGERGIVSVSDLAMIEAESFSDTEMRVDEIVRREPPTGIRVLYVEDNIDLRRYVNLSLTSFGHTVVTAANGIDGWKNIQNDLPDIIVSDVMMPGLDGFDLTRLVKTTPKTRKIPVILITAKSETDARIEGLEIGADDYMGKPIDMRELNVRIKNIVSDRKVRDALTRAEEVEERSRQLVYGFSRSLELRDGYTGGHSEDVLAFGTIIADGLGIPMNPALRDALMLHDIGKLGIPDGLLHKPGRLTPQEWTIMRQHPELGAELLRQFDSLTEMSKSVLHHHECWDGSGYPGGLMGEDIPLGSRIIAVADAWHAMREDRTYRKAIPLEDAINELIENRGRQFDPSIVDCFLDGLITRRLVPGELVEEIKAQY